MDIGPVARPQKAIRHYDSKLCKPWPMEKSHRFESAHR